MRRHCEVNISNDKSELYDKIVSVKLLFIVMISSAIQVHTV